MNIQSAGQIFTYNNQEAAKNTVLATTKEQQLQSTESAVQSDGKTPNSYTINMNNISPNEYNALTKAGVTDLADPIIFPDGRLYLDGSQTEMGDQSTDYLGQINKQIQYAKAQGDVDTVEHLTDRLLAVKELHGQTVTLQNNFLDNLTA